MYIKYLNIIHNLSNYNSIVPVKDASIIQLQEGDDRYILAFPNQHVRDEIINKIWEELEKGSTTLNLDKEIKLFIDVDKYNLFKTED